MSGLFQNPTLMTDWRYGDAGDRLHVQVGDVWMVGPHIFACGDLEKGHAKWLTHYCRVPMMAYTDPPWNEGNLKAFHTKAKQPYGLTFRPFLEHLAEALKRVEGDIFIEMGTDTRDLLIEVMASAGAVLLNDWGIRYMKTHPCRLLQFAFNEEVPRLFNFNFTDMDDAETPLAAIRAVEWEGGCVFDPCLGLGTTAMAAAKAGSFCLGLELNPRRLAVSIDKIAKHLRLPAEKVTQLPEVYDGQG